MWEKDVVLIKKTVKFIFFYDLSLKNDKVHESRMRVAFQFTPRNIHGWVR